MMRTFLIAALIILGAAPLAAEVQRATVNLVGTENSPTFGTVIFTKEEGGVRVVADVFNLSPGLHGWHIHLWGDATSPTGVNMGPHYKPEHPLQATDPDFDLGALGNLMANELGYAHYDALVPHLELEGEYSIIGRGVIVHENMDVFSQAGRSGGPTSMRIAQGTIGIASNH